MKRTTQARLLVASTLAAAIGEVSVGAAQPCESLASLILEKGRITNAQVFAARAFSRPTTGPFAADQGFSNPVAFCRVEATLTPTADSDIKIEVWMPTAGWNGKFQAVGNGGWAGFLAYPAMAETLGRGYATSSTDTGHTGGSGSFVIGHPEKYIDFAYRAVHEMTVKAKAIVTAFYATPPKRSYWNGCSTGGRQGLAEVQRYPNDFDGVIAGAQANPRTHLNAWGISLAQAALTDPAAFIPPTKYPAIHRAVLTACDALDGVTDGLVSEPTRCKFDPQILACEGADGPGCLTARQVQTARTMMSPAKTAGGAEIFPGHALGAELGWGALAEGPEPVPLVIDHYRYVVFKDPTWEWRTFSMDRDVAIADKVDNGTINAIDPNIQSFTRRGGKLLMYHGWADALVSPGTSINYFNTVVKALGGPAKTAESVRLFMVPGMGHCRGGDGPNTFDMMAALERWVEGGIAPDRIIASHMNDGRADRTRPLCPYPQVAVYRGTGNTDDEANFACSVR